MAPHWTHTLLSFSPIPYRHIDAYPKYMSQDVLSAGESLEAPSHSPSTTRICWGRWCLPREHCYQGEGKKEAIKLYRIQWRYQSYISHSCHIISTYFLKKHDTFNGMDTFHSLMENIFLVLLLKERPFSDQLWLLTQRSRSCRWYTHRSDQKWLFNVQAPHFPQKREANNSERLDTWPTCMKKSISSRKSPIHLAAGISHIKNAALIYKGKKTQRKFSWLSPSDFPDGKLSYQGLGSSCWKEITIIFLLQMKLISA